MEFVKEFFEKVDFEKNNQQTTIKKNHAKRVNLTADSSLLDQNEADGSTASNEASKSGSAKEKTFMDQYK